MKTHQEIERMAAALRRRLTDQLQDNDQLTGDEFNTGMADTIRIQHQINALNWVMGYAPGTFEADIENNKKNAMPWDL